MSKYTTLFFYIFGIHDLKIRENITLFAKYRKKSLFLHSIIVIHYYSSYIMEINDNNGQQPNGTQQQLPYGQPYGPAPQPYGNGPTRWPEPPSPRVNWLALASILLTVGGFLMIILNPFDGDTFSNIGMYIVIAGVICSLVA